MPDGIPDHDMTKDGIRGDLAGLPRTVENCGRADCAICLLGEEHHRRVGSDMRETRFRRGWVPLRAARLTLMRHAHERIIERLGRCIECPASAHYRSSALELIE